jgi:hypothetical protein
MYESQLKSGIWHMLNVQRKEREGRALRVGMGKDRTVTGFEGVLEPSGRVEVA